MTDERRFAATSSLQEAFWVEKAQRVKFHANAMRIEKAASPIAPIITDAELNAALPVMKKLLWAERALRQKVQTHGVNVAPANFYSNNPSIDEVLCSYEYRDNAPYLIESLFVKERLLRELSTLIKYAEEFVPAEEGDEINCRSFFWRNSQFSHSDAMSYYAYVRHVKPRKVIEIGSGYSSLVALEAIKRNGVGSLHCIEPFPRPFISTLGGEGSMELHKMRAQDVSAEMLNDMLSDGDILFIDSTHTVKTGSDCLHIYLRLLPNICRNIYVHVHDIFLPFGLPQLWLLDRQIFWTEQYLLLALMIDNPRVSVLYGSAYHNHFNPELLESLMFGRFQKGGGSFWFKYAGKGE